MSQLLLSAVGYIAEVEEVADPVVDGTPWEDLVVEDTPTDDVEGFEEDPVEDDTTFPVVDGTLERDPVVEVTLDPVEDVDDTTEDVDLIVVVEEDPDRLPVVNDEDAEDPVVDEVLEVVVDEEVDAAAMEGKLNGTPDRGCDIG